jgi:hypothetical protein
MVLEWGVPTYHNKISVAAVNKPNRDLGGICLYIEARSAQYRCSFRPSAYYFGKGQRGGSNVPLCAYHS